MICEFDSMEFSWSTSNDLTFPKSDDKITFRVKELLRIAKLNTVDLIIFPELSIPEKLIEKLQEWSKEQESIIICGSHYYSNHGVRISRCPIIIKGNVYFTEKIHPSPLEKSPISGNGLNAGRKVIKFINSFIGNFAVLICSDYLEENLKGQLDLQSLDILCVPSFQRDSALYHSRMNIDCENSQSGIYILYSNFKDEKYGDGNSAVFGIMDKIYLDKLSQANYTDLNPAKKLFNFAKSTEYFIGEINLEVKRPFANRNISTAPNFQFLSSNIQTKNKDLAFIQKVAHDDERYKRIDELYVPPIEYEEIIGLLREKSIVFIIGDPGIGKTYSAVKILKEFFEKGYEPIWFAGLEKEEREVQSKILSDFSPSDKQIVYFEDPFGRTAFERRDSLFQVFSPLLDKLSHLNSKVIITSRKEIFELFSKESLLEKEVLQLKKELNIRNPSYNTEGLCLIFNKLASMASDFFDVEEYRNLVYDAIKNGKIATPLAIRDLVFVSKNIKSKQTLLEHIERRGNETVKVFALEILASAISAKLILYLTFFSGTKGKPFLSDLFTSVSKQLMNLNFHVASFSFNIEIRSQIGYRIEQFGSIKSAYKFSHPVYEEALASLIVSDAQCETIAKLILREIAKKDLSIAFIIVNKYVIKYPEVALILYKDILENNSQPEDRTIRIALSLKLISTYFVTKNEDFFNLALHFYSLKELVFDINNTFIDWSDLSQKLTLCLRYVNNSPLHFDSSLTDSLEWEKILSNKNDDYFTPSRTLHLMLICSSLNPVALSIFINKKGTNLIKKIYLLIDENDRKRLFKLLKGYSLQKELKRYKNSIEELGETEITKKFHLFRKVIFSEKKYYGKVTIDDGAKRAIMKPWLNILPVGILSIIGSFASGSLVAIYGVRSEFIGVGVVEYSSEDLQKIIGHSSNEFHELIGYYHTSCAVKAEFMKKFKSIAESTEWEYISK